MILMHLLLLELVLWPIIVVGKDYEILQSQYSLSLSLLLLYFELPGEFATGLGIQ